MKSADKNTEVLLSEVGKLNGLTSSLSTPPLSAAIIFLGPVAAAALLMACFPHAFSPSWTPLTLIGASIPVIILVLLQRREEQRKKIGFMFNLSWIAWVVMSLATVSYCLKAGTREFGNSLALLNPGWLTLIFGWFFAAACGRVALSISKLLHS
ncbi:MULTISPECIES: hypothetical protein [unclassified Rhizobium]|uniref:hypothetical protein n=1 Tax=unclassified Rhizobium TaxID=2613769 RepID=UPI000EA85578|nr:MULTISPECIES: hypothetical protein [unclassified Rhizobium]AYG68506.1 hypothetical protein CCGE531_20435 [Rhizobium sp. CCGE531]AYG74889.1 hypothetical protein CCGE532_19920 [Rhizobium sp. CCGE532]